jgi:hypothetical protein
MTAKTKALGGLLAGIVAAIGIYFAVIVPAVIAAARPEWQKDDDRLERGIVQRLDSIEKSGLRVEEKLDQVIWRTIPK